MLRSDRRKPALESNHVACSDEERRPLLPCKSYENCDTSFQEVVILEYRITSTFLAVDLELQKHKFRKFCSFYKPLSAGQRIATIPAKWTANQRFFRRAVVLSTKFCRGAALPAISFPESTGSTVSGLVAG